MTILKPQAAWRVLDVGSAAGTLAVPLAERVKAVTALDPSERMRELLQQRCAQDALDSVRWMLPGLTTDEEGRLRGYLARTLVQEARHMKLPYRRVVRWAVIWWDTNGLED